MVYNTTNLTSANTIVEIYAAVNQISNYVFTGMILLSLFLIIFMVFSNYPKRYVLLADSFVISIVSVLLFFLGMIGWPILIPPILVFFGSVLMLKFLPD